MKLVDNKLISLVKKELPALMPSVIVKNDDGWIVFNKYHLYKESESLYSVYSNGDHVGDFGSTKVALTWCIASKKNKIMMANQILSLEKNKQRLITHLDCLQKLAQRAKTVESYDIIFAKITAQKVHINSVETELNKCVSLAKYWQIQGFSYETSRTINSKTVSAI